MDLWTRRLLPWIVEIYHSFHFLGVANVKLWEVVDSFNHRKWILMLFSKLFHLSVKSLMEVYILLHAHPLKHFV